MLIAAGDTSADLLRELTERTIRQLETLIPAPTGFWRGRKVRLDCKGVYSSGYWGFTAANPHPTRTAYGYPPIHTWDEIVLDEDSPRTKRLKAERDRLLATLHRKD